LAGTLEALTQRLDVLSSRLDAMEEGVGGRLGSVTERVGALDGALAQRTDGHSLFGLPNVIFAPHVAGVTREAVDRMSEQTARNILSALDGEPIRQNVINQDVLA